MPLASLRVQTFHREPRTLAEWTRAEGDMLRLVYGNVRRLTTEANFDWVTGIEGRTGMGKSTLAKKIARASVGKEGKVTTVYDVLSLLEAMLAAVPGRGDCIIFDEGANGMFSRQAMTSENKAFVLTMMVARAKRVHVICIIPNRDWFDVYFRGDSMRFVAHVQELGYATFYAITGPPRWEGDKGRRLFDHEFRDMREDEKDDYEPRKMMFIEQMLSEQIDKLKSKADPDFKKAKNERRDATWTEAAKETAKAPDPRGRSPEKMREMQRSQLLEAPWSCPICPDFAPTLYKQARGVHVMWHKRHGDVPQPPYLVKNREAMRERARAKASAKKNGAS